MQCKTVFTLSFLDGLLVQIHIDAIVEFVEYICADDNVNIWLNCQIKHVK